MLSPDYFDFRWSWYQPILNRGEDISVRCKVNVRRLPVRYTAEDGKEYLPYVMDTIREDAMYTALRLLRDYSIRYMLEHEKVSAHQLPVLNPVARQVMKHLQQHYPHLPQSLLHHWCGEPKGALVLLEMWQSMWQQSWRQDQVDHAPWVAAVNILMLKQIREAIAKLPQDHAEHLDHIMVCVAGGLYDWALKTFLKNHVDGAVEVTRIATYESMVIPLTPIAFLYRQPADALLGDDRFVIMSYGLEPDIVPRMRQIRDKVGRKYEAGICPLLAEDRMGAHMLRRSWVRLALWELAEKTRQGVWMQWVLQAKKLDQLITYPESLPKAAIALLEKSRTYPVAAWILRRLDVKTKKKGDAATPWLQDDRVLQTFRVFEEDVAIEQRRRKEERVWLNRQQVLASKRRGKEVEQALLRAWESGELIYFRSAEESLHGGASLSAKQACLRMDWATYLFHMEKLSVNLEHLIQDRLMKELMRLVEASSEVFMDDVNGVGCVLRGEPVAVLHVGLAIYRLLAEQYIDATRDDAAPALSYGQQEQKKKTELGQPSPSICVAMQGDWTVVDADYPKWGHYRVASGASMVQVDAALGHDENIAALIAWRNKKVGKESFGRVHIEGVSIGTSNALPVLYNQGFALTEDVLNVYERNLENRAQIKHLNIDAPMLPSLFKTYRIVGDMVNITTITPHDDDAEMMIFVYCGGVRLNGVNTRLYELLDPTTEAAQLIRAETLMM